LQDDGGIIRGGIIAATYWNWLDIQAMWLDEALRGQGYGAEMLDIAEEEAFQRDCDQGVVDVVSFQNVGFFEACGYSTFASLTDRPPGHTTYFMKKSLLA